MKMSANRNDSVVDHPTRWEGQWNAIRRVTLLAAEYPELVRPPPRTCAHNMQNSALPLHQPTRVNITNVSLVCGSHYVVQGSLLQIFREISACDTDIVAGYETSCLKITELSKQIIDIKRTTALNNFLISELEHSISLTKSSRWM